MKLRFFRRQALFTAAAGVLSAAAGLTFAPTLAHHANGPFYDPDNRVEIQGTVTRFVFRNPHAFLFIDVPAAGDEVVEWQVELGAPISLRRVGWTPDSLTVGTLVKVAGNKSRAEGTFGLCCVRMTREDGSPILSGGRIEEEGVPQ